MIPSRLNWNYKRTDIQDSATFNVCCKMNIADDDIYLQDFIEKDLDKFMMFVCCIGKQPPINNNVVFTILITDENLTNEQLIPKGYYYCTYLCPSRYPIITSGIEISDIFNEETKICLDYPYIFNSKFCCRSQFPINTFILN